MKIAIISDIHANLEALTVCLKKIDEIKPEKIICLGDLVDYCADPNECIELIKKYCDVVLMGNHDEAQLNYFLVEGFNENAMISSVHTRSIIKPEYLEYFKTLPYTYSLNNFLFIHASPMYPENYSYILNIKAAEENFYSFKEDICFIGHSHKPIIFQKSETCIQSVNDKEVKKGNKYIINVGSVGQPRDGNPCLCIGVIDTGLWEYRNIRIEYDTQKSSDKIKNEGLPVFLADRILKGV